MRISVVLPAPFSPRTPCTSARRRLRSILSLATRSPKRLVMPRSSTTGGTSTTAAAWGDVTRGRSARTRLLRGRDDRARRLRLVDVDAEGAAADLRLALLHLVHERLRDASRDRGVDGRQRRAALAHHAEVLQVLRGVGAGLHLVDDVLDR